MYFSFSEEASYGLDATSQDYAVDLISEEVITNMNYNKVIEFNYPTSQSRIPGTKTSHGRIQLEMTYGNPGWNSLFKSLIGKSIVLSDFAFAKSSESWNIVTGILNSDIDSSETSFSIEEYKQGEFNNVDGIIIGSEYIAINSISNGSVTSSLRGSELTTATSHGQHNLVYGVVSDEGRNLEIIYRYRSGFCYYLPTSLTCLIYREGDYFCFNGGKFSDFVFNAEMNTIESSFEFLSRNTRIIDVYNPNTSTDNNELVSPLHINCYSMNSEFKIKKLYMQISNSIVQNSSKFFETTFQNMALGNHSAYGQFTLDEESSSAFESYINDDLKNLSVNMCESKDFTNAYVFSFNNIRYGTMLHLLYSSIDMKGDSVPFYSFDPDGFNLIIQS